MYVVGAWVACALCCASTRSRGKRYANSSPFRTLGELLTTVNGYDPVNYQLGVVNPCTGAAALRGAKGGHTGIAFACAADNKCYGISHNAPSNLFEIDPSNGAYTQLATGFPTKTMDLDFNPLEPDIIYTILGSSENVFIHSFNRNGPYDFGTGRKVSGSICSAIPFLLTGFFQKKLSLLVPVTILWDCFSTVRVTHTAVSIQRTQNASIFRWKALVILLNNVYSLHNQRSRIHTVVLR